MLGAKISERHWGKEAVLKNIRILCPLMALCYVQSIKCISLQKVLIRPTVKVAIKPELKRHYIRSIYPFSQGLVLFINLHALYILKCP